MLHPHKKHYSVEDYLALEEKAEYKSEYHDGEIVMMSGATSRHDQIALNITSALNFAFKGRPCRVFSSYMQIRVERRNRFLYSDAAAICGAVEYYDDKQRGILNPTVIFEVASESTRNYDRGAKFKLYKTLPSLQHYILVEQDSMLVTHFRRSSTNFWEAEVLDEPQETLDLLLLNFSISLADIYDKIGLEVTEPGSYP